MKRLRWLIVFLVGIQTSYYAQSDYAADQLICAFKKSYLGQQPNLRHKVTSVLEGIVKQNPEHIVPLSAHEEGPWLITYSSSETKDILEIIQAYEDTGIFEFVEPDFVGEGGGKIMLEELVPNDGFFFRQWGLVNDGSFNLSTSRADADIDMDEAWELHTGSKDLIVAILDSGLKLDHPEFEGRLWQNDDEKASGSDTDMNGYADDLHGGWDFVNDDNMPVDDHGHGTNVAGIAVASGNNGIGYAGVDWNSRVMICKILDDENSGFYSDWTAAIYYAVDNGAKVINMSVGGPSFSRSMGAAVKYAYDKGVVIVVSMMNFNTDAQYYPAAYEQTIAVGSTNSDDRRTEPFFWNATSGSNYGEHIDVVAPGNYIYGLNYLSNTSYGTYWGGTSQAAPLVSGLCALLLAQDPSRTPDEIREIIQLTAEDQVSEDALDKPGFDVYYGHGRINAHKALASGLTTSNKQLFSKAQITVFPNPGSRQDHLVISFDRTSAHPVYAYLSDIHGKIIGKYSIPPRQIHYRIYSDENWPSGVLLLTLKGKSAVKTLKILHR